MYTIEADWQDSAHTQPELVHLWVHEDEESELRAWAERTPQVLYPDGGILHVRVRNYRNGDLRAMRRSHMNMIALCAQQNVSRIIDLRKPGAPPSA